MGNSIRREIMVLQPREDVWRALTDSGAFAGWLMPNDMEPRVGHRFTFRGEANPKVGYDGIVHCEVTFRLESEGDGTRLVFEHSGFDLTQPWSDVAFRGAEHGWDRMLTALTGVVADLAAR